MYCFIPSWYSTKRTWQMYDRQFYRAADFSEFDDTVSQVRMFLDAGEEVRLIPLCYAPNLRRFLHRQGIPEVPVLSIFDRIQDIHGDETAVISYKDYSWPEDIEWDFTPFVITTYLHGEHYASIEFDEDGNLLWINRYEQNAEGTEQPGSRLVFDDRGFISSILYFENGQAAYREYFNREGIWQIREDAQTGSVSVNPSAARRFQKSVYARLEDLIQEELEGMLEELNEQDTLVIAAKEQHDLLVLGAGTRQKAILSFYGDRYALDHADVIRQEAARAAAIVADTEEAAQQLRAITLNMGVAVHDLSPFDMRLSPGRSQQIRALRIFFPIDGLQEPIRSRALQQLFQILESNADAELDVITRKSDSSAAIGIANEIRALLDEHPEVRLEVAGREQAADENRIEGEQSAKGPRIHIRGCMHESDIAGVLQFTRLIVDIRDNPDQYIQIAGISTGIPQINYRHTRYIAHQKNGYMIHNISNLQNAVNYYLDGLAHWNEALVYNIHLIAEFTGDTIVERWKEMAGNG